MLKVPSFILRRLYVKGSLSHVEDGFQFQLCNKLGAGYARQIFPLEVDGEGVPLEQCTFEVNGDSHAFNQVSRETPFTLALNKTTTITVHGKPLNDGNHNIAMSFEVPGLGSLKFDFTDVVSHG